MQTEQPKIFLIGDTHFGHANMIPYCGRPENFDDVIISNWNKIVGYNDIVIHLGDVIMGQNSAERLPGIMASLPGKKILVRGNHDTEKKWGTGIGFMERGFDFACDYFVYDRYVFSHCPMTPLPNQANLEWRKPVELCLHAHFHNKFPENPDIEQNRHYNVSEYLANKGKYQLVQIEDKLSPLSLEEVLGLWLDKNHEK